MNHGSIYFDTSSKGLRNGINRYSNCWCAEIEYNGKKFRKRSKNINVCKTFLLGILKSIDHTITQLPDECFVERKQSDKSESNVLIAERKMELTRKILNKKEKAINDIEDRNTSLRESCLHHKPVLHRYGRISMNEQKKRHDLIKECSDTKSHVCRLRRELEYEKKWSDIVYNIELCKQAQEDRKSDIRIRNQKKLSELYDERIKKRKESKDKELKDRALLRKELRDKELKDRELLRKELRDKKQKEGELLRFERERIRIETQNAFRRNVYTQIHIVEDSLYRDAGEGIRVSCEGYVKFYTKPIPVSMTTDQRSGIKRTATCYLKGKKYSVSKLVAKAFIYGYDDTKRIIYKDGNCHNVEVNNLKVVTQEVYNKYISKRLVVEAEDYERRTKRAERLMNESKMTYTFFKTRDFSEINKYVSCVLLPELNDYLLRRFNYGKKKSEYLVCEVVSILYDQIDHDKLIMDYIKYCKRMILQYRKLGGFGYLSEIPESIYDNVDKMNLECLKQKYNVTKK